MRSLSNFKNLCIRLIIYFHNISKLLNLILTWEQRKTSVKLRYNCTKAPNIDSCCVWNSKNDFWSSIKPRLDVSVNSLSKEATTSIIDHFNTRFVLLLKKNILWLQITMDQVMCLLILQCLKNLNGKPSY
jgi:hypothetical protein